MSYIRHHLLLPIQSHITGQCTHIPHRFLRVCAAGKDLYWTATGGTSSGLTDFRQNSIPLAHAIPPPDKQERPSDRSVKTISMAQRSELTRTIKRKRQWLNLTSNLRSRMVCLQDLYGNKNILPTRLQIKYGRPWCPPNRSIFFIVATGNEPSPSNAGEKKLFIPKLQTLPVPIKGGTHRIPETRWNAGPGITTMI